MGKIRMCFTGSVFFIYLTIVAIKSISCVHSDIIDPESFREQAKINTYTKTDSKTLAFHSCPWIEWIIHQYKTQSGFKSKMLFKNILKKVKPNICEVDIQDLTESESCVDFTMINENNSSYFDHHNFSDTCLKKQQGHFDKVNVASVKNLGSYNKRLKRSGFMELASMHNECVGSLIIHHDSDNGVLLDDYSILRLSEKRYPMLKLLKTRQIFMIDLDGNCRWKLYSQPGFRGKSMIISSSTYYLSFHPMSALKIN